jgi:hypothetical protein
VSDPEKVTRYWPQGFFFWRPKVVYAEGYQLKGIPNGKWIYRYQSGQKQLEGEYLSGKKTGVWIKWYPNGVKATEGEFLYGKMHGKWTDYHSNGQKALESHWVMGKRDGKWTSWNAEGALGKPLEYDHNREEDKGYSLHTDLETKQIVRDIQRKKVQKTWENLVGRSVAQLIKPWHVACWTIIFIPLFGFLKMKTPWRGLALAAVLAFLITSLLSWSLDKRRPKL